MTRRQNRMFFKIGFAFLGAAVVVLFIHWLCVQFFGEFPAHVQLYLMFIFFAVLILPAFIFIGWLGMAPVIHTNQFLEILSNNQHAHIHTKLSKTFLQDYRRSFNSPYNRLLFLITDDPRVRKELESGMTMEERVRAGLD